MVSDNLLKGVLVMRVDYDGIQRGYESEVNTALREMIGYLKEAMEDGDVTRQGLRYQWVICDTCEGEGGHSRRFGAMTHEEFSDWDDDSQEAYLSGRYDECCEACNGSGKLRELDIEILTKDAQDWIEAYERNVYEAAAERAAERRWGC
jgi:hypothetical protein